jgi:hypothetical protein
MKLDNDRRRDVGEGQGARVQNCPIIGCDKERYNKDVA